MKQCDGKIDIRLYRPQFHFGGFWVGFTKSKKKTLFFTDLIKIFYVHIFNRK